MMKIKTKKLFHEKKQETKKQQIKTKHFISLINTKMSNFCVKQITTNLKCQNDDNKKKSIFRTKREKEEEKKKRKFCLYLNFDKQNSRRRQNVNIFALKFVCLSILISICTCKGKLFTS